MGTPVGRIPWCGVSHPTNGVIPVQPNQKEGVFATEPVDTRLLCDPKLEEWDLWANKTYQAIHGQLLSLVVDRVSQAGLTPQGTCRLVDVSPCELVHLSDEVSERLQLIIIPIGKALVSALEILQHYIRALSRVVSQTEVRRVASRQLQFYRARINLRGRAGRY